ncbi:MAG TPA: T9SS type A sorting domain-containing protein [Blastocatellia bacterium]|nr:T9SS type A sorting domain-containing protein [Blastocatellia bacterium]
MDYILENDLCPGDADSYIEQRWGLRNDQWRIWADTVKDSIATPLDTNNLTLEELGLEWIRPNKSVAADGQPLKSLGVVSVENNPFRKSTEVTLEILRDGHARIEIYDMLGRQHYDLGNSNRFCKGKHLIELPQDLPVGTLLLRVSTPGGEIKTVQLKKLE